MSDHEREAFLHMKDTYIYRAIRKYGWDNFTKEIIDYAEDSISLEIKEKQWIAFYDSRNPEKGYNIAEGGTGGPVRKGMKNTPEHNRRISEAHKGIKPSEDIKRRISETLKKKGWCGTEETRQKQKERVSNLIWITDGKINKRVPKEKEEEMLKEGWRRGRKNV